MSLDTVNSVEPSGKTVDYIDQVFGAVESGDMSKFRDSFTPNGVVWHNIDDREQDVETAAVTIAGVCAISTERRYEDIRSVRMDNVWFRQHVLTVSLSSGHRMRLPAMMKITLADGGRIARYEEYFDSRALDVLAAPPIQDGAV